MTNRDAHQSNTPALEEDTIRRKFLGWQCRLRQQTVRESDGRPTPGMCPEVIIGKDEVLGRVTILILKKELKNHTAQFQHLVKKTRDPLERWEGAIGILSKIYFQDPDTFSQRMTALFGPDSRMPDQLLETGQCLLKFEQQNQQYQLPCAVSELSMDNEHYQGTYWHNSMFNPNIPGDAKILCFEPDWSQIKS